MRQGIFDVLSAPLFDFRAGTFAPDGNKFPSRQAGCSRRKIFLEDWTTRRNRYTRKLRIPRRYLDTGLPDKYPRNCGNFSRSFIPSIAHSFRTLHFSPASRRGRKSQPSLPFSSQRKLSVVAETPSYPWGRWSESSPSSKSSGRIVRFNNAAYIYQYNPRSDVHPSK